MKQPPKVGTTAEKAFTVEVSQAIEFGDAGPAVLATPSLVWFLEHAAIDALVPALEPGEISLGVHVALDHLAATPLGRRVVCTARVVHSEGQVVSFQLEAADEHQTIARGFHKRRVVSREKFAARVAKK